MKNKISKLMVLVVGATIALATVGVGYGLWFEQLHIQGNVTTGTVALAFVDVAPVPQPHNILGGGPWGGTPYSDDDDVVNNVANDPLDIGVCAFPNINDDADGFLNEDAIDGIDNDGDLLIDEDPPGKLSTCDPRSSAVWTSSPLDEDGDGAVDEDPSDGADNDLDGLVDEDGIGGWVMPFPPATAGQDLGRTIAYVEDAGKTLQVALYNPAVFVGGLVYSPTVYAKIVNNGTVPVIVTDIRLTLTPPYELWDRDGVGGITDGGVLGACDVGDECAAPLTVLLTGLVENQILPPIAGTVLMPGVPVDVVLKVYMTPAAKPTVTYGLIVQITGNQFNEP